MNRNEYRQNHVKAIERPLYKVVVNAYQKAASRGWPRIYWCIDIHDTLYPSTYQKDEAGTLKAYPGAKEFIDHLMSLDESIIILWSSLWMGTVGSPQNDFQPYFNDLFGYMPKAIVEDRVFFNENPLEKSTEYAHFGKKFYFSVLLDDKAGFDPSIDYLAISLALNHVRETYVKDMQCVK